MRYPFLTLLETTTIILELLIAVTIFYFLVRIFKKVKFTEAAKAVGLYWVVCIVLNFIYPFSFFSYNIYFYILGNIIFFAIVFASFYLISKKFLVISLKKSLILFFLAIIVAFPVVVWVRQVIVYQGLIKIPVFAREFEEIISDNSVFSILNQSFFSLPYPYKITNAIEKGTLSWPGDKIRELVLIWPEQ